MTEYRAKYIGCYHDGWEHTELTYEYRGYEYTVIRHNNGYMDKSIKTQHKEAQEDIDRMIENKNKEPEAWKYEGSAQEGFDTFWSYVNQ